MTIEAVAGKNPVSHVGKLYNLVAIRIAEAASRCLPAVKGASCILVSQIGSPISDPQIVDVCLALQPGSLDSSMIATVQDVVNEQFGQLPQLQAALLDGTVAVY